MHTHTWKLFLFFISSIFISVHLACHLKWKMFWINEWNYMCTVFSCKPLAIALDFLKNRVTMVFICCREREWVHVKRVITSIKLKSILKWLRLLPVTKQEFIIWMCNVEREGKSEWKIPTRKCIKCLCASVEWLIQMVSSIST